MFRIFKGESISTLSIGLVFVASLILMPTIGQTRELSNGLPIAQDMKAETVTVNGKVKAVTESSLTIVDDQKAEHTISLDAKTKVTKGGKAATAADLKADDSVVVVANKGEDKSLTAVSITVS
jgi:hypothetical protein